MKGVRQSSALCSAKVESLMKACKINCLNFLKVRLSIDFATFSGNLKPNLPKIVNLLKSKLKFVKKVF